MNARSLLWLRAGRVFWHVMRGVVTAFWVLPWADQRLRGRLIQNWARQLMHLLQITVDLQGHMPEPGTPPFILTSNHISWVDIFVIHSACPVRFVSKAEVRQWPVLGWLAAKTGTLFLHRASRRQTATIGREMEAVLRGGDCLGLFPESTTSDGSGVLPFRTSLLQPAVRTETPVLPIALHYSLTSGGANPHIPFVGDMTFAQSLLMVLTSPPSRANILIGAMIRPTPHEHRRELALQLENTTRNLLNAWMSALRGGIAVHRAPETAPGLPDAPPSDARPTGIPYPVPAHWNPDADPTPTSARK